MKKLFLSLCALAVLPLVFSGCGEDGIIEAGELEGRWEVAEASRNGEATTTMEGLYYVFTSDGNLQTNMMGAEETFTYELNGDEITQRGGSLDADYKIEAYEAGQLVLTTQLRGKDFRMVLDKR